MNPTPPPRSEIRGDALAGYVYCSAMSWEDSVRGRGLWAPMDSGDGKAYKFGRERTIFSTFLSMQ